MQKSHVAKVVKKELQISDKDYDDALDAILKKIAAALIRGEKVTLRNFGTFTVRQHQARKGVNPQDGSSLKIDKKRVVKFNSCKALKDKVNKGK